MKPQTLSKLDLLATAKEAALLEALERHNKTLQHYESQRTVLALYQERLTAGWHGGNTVPAGEAARAARFAAQAEAARKHLAQSMQTEQDQKAECTVALASLRTYRETLHERLKLAQRSAANQIQDRIERYAPNLHKLAATDDILF